MKDESKPREKTVFGRGESVIVSVLLVSMLGFTGVGYYQIYEQQRGREMATAWWVAMWVLLGLTSTALVLLIVRLRRARRR